MNITALVVKATYIWNHQMVNKLRIAEETNTWYIEVF